MRVEAASLLMRPLGLTQGDFAGAHDILTRADAPGLDVQLRRYLLLGRLWLRLFGPDIGPRISPDSDLLLDPKNGSDHASYEIATAAGCLFLQTVGTGCAAPVLRLAARLEREIDVEPVAWCRARAVRRGLRFGVESFSEGLPPCTDRPYARGRTDGTRVLRYC